MASTVSTLFSHATYANFYKVTRVVYSGGIVYFTFVASSSTSVNNESIGIYNISSPAGSIPIMLTLTGTSEGLAVDSTGSYIYVSQNSGGIVYKISTTSPYTTTNLNQIINASYSPGALAIDTSGNIYAFDKVLNDNLIVKQDTSNNVSVIATNGALANTTALVITSDNNTLYALAGQTIQKVTISSGAVVQVASNIVLYNSTGLAINPSNTYLFGTNGVQVFAFKISTGVISTIAGTGNVNIVDGPSLTTAEFALATGITIGPNAVMYVCDGFTISESNRWGYMRQIQNFDPYSPPAPTTPCFKEGSKILTDKGYVPIENIRKGDMLKTVNNGFVAVYCVGVRQIHHASSGERSGEQLYVCSAKNYPQLSEDLVITGYHSILVEDFTDDEQRAATKKVLGAIYATDGYYRLPACVDQRTHWYPEEGDFNIYHLALENNDYYMNYGIYANGLLVESTSKRYMLELSGMKLLE
jgi:hypothetical protein